MCDIPQLTQILIWTFAGSTLVMALLSRKLNDHLLEIPPQPTGPFAILFRRRYHVRIRFFLAPEKYFDAAGLQWAKRFLAVTGWSVLMLAALGYVLYACRVKFGG